MEGAYYPVIPVAIDEVEQRADEHLGTKKKSWVLREDGHWWLYKQARPSALGEAWAEKIAAEIAELVGVAHAVVELAWESTDGLGTISRSFLSESEQLYHGNDILRQAIPSYNPTLKHGQCDHMVKNIFNALSKLKSTESIEINMEQTVTGLVSYAILDGLIGNTDRHHENWGLRYNRNQEHPTYILAPSFDHSSSLGRELPDCSKRKTRCRRGIIDSGGMLKYLLNGKGGVFRDFNPESCLPPLRLAQSICRLVGRLQPDLVNPWLEKLDAVLDDHLRAVVEKVPRGIMSDTAKEFAHHVVVISKSELLRDYDDYALPGLA